MKKSTVAPNFASLTVDGKTSTVRIYSPEEDIAFGEWVASEYSLRLDFEKHYSANRETTGKLGLWQRFWAAISKGTLINVRPLERTAAYPLDVLLNTEGETAP